MDRKEAIEIIKKNWPDGRHQLSEALETLIPELKESEDERIRKELIEQVVYIVPNDDEVDSEGYVLPTYQKRIDKYRAWLEKQGSQNLANSAKSSKVEPKFKIGDKIKHAGQPDRCAEKIIAIRDDAYYFSEVVSLPFIEQDKWEFVGQKPADKVEPIEGEFPYVNPSDTLEGE